MNVALPAAAFRAVREMPSGPTSRPGSRGFRTPTRVRDSPINIDKADRMCFFFGKNETCLCVCIECDVAIALDKSRKLSALQPLRINSGVCC